MDMNKGKEGCLMGFPSCLVGNVNTGSGRGKGKGCCSEKAPHYFVMTWFQDNQYRGHAREKMLL